LQRLLKNGAAKNQAATDKVGWIIGFGYSQLKEQRHPNRDELDQVSTTLPIMIVHQSGYLASLLKMRAKPRQDRATAAAVGAVHFKIE